jgi:hypothetical protein
MHRARASVPPDAIRIEDEVWQEAFRERPRSRARLRSLDGGRSSERPALVPGRAAARRVSGSVTPRPVGTVTASRPASAVELPAPEVPLLDLEPSTWSESEASTWSAPEPPARRTVTITGRGAERNLPVPSEAARRRATRRAHERAGFRPDRFAMWALFLGLLLVLVAATSAHG